MLEFKKIEPEDWDWMKQLFELSGQESLEYSFTTTYLWNKSFRYRVARMDNYLIILSDMKKPTYLYPAGTGDVKPVIEAMIKDAHDRGTNLVFHTILEKHKAELEGLFPNQFIITSERNNADYIYETEKLSTLKGKKLSSKRNHINRFIEKYPDWSYERITRDNIDEAYAMHQEWCRLASIDASDSLLKESASVRVAFENFFALGLDGGILRAGGQVVAFSMGDALSKDTYLVHIEKAFAHIQGAYPMINQQFVLHNCQQYKFVNREDDAGDEGLRKAKLSYRPVRLVDKYSAVFSD